MDDDKLSDVVKKCLDILDENIKIIADVEFNLKDEQEDEMTPDMELHNLYDMTEDVAESAKLRRAEFHLSKRQSDNL